MIRFKLIPAVYIVIRNGDEILMLQRKNTGFHDGDFSLPAGHVDGGESLKSAVQREAQEELGISIDPTDLSLVHVLHRGSDTPNNENERVDFYFATSGFQGTISNKEPEKCEKLEWFTLDHLPENIVPQVRSVLELMAREDMYSEMGWSN